MADDFRDVKIPRDAPIVALDFARAQDAVAANNMSALHRILG